MSIENIQKLHETGFFQSLDLQIADMARRAVDVAEEEDFNLYAAALASRAVGLGHACADLADYAGKEWSKILEEQLPGNGDDGNVELSMDTPAREDHEGLGGLPDLDSWEAALNPTLFGAGGEKGEQRTLFVRQGSRVFLRRYWDYERKVETKLKGLMEEDRLYGEVDDEVLRRYFPGADEKQKAAARNAIEKKLSILSGGPGTGKTFTMARAVAIMAEQKLGDPRRLEIRMVAPTGKAAVRMKESIRDAKAGLGKEGVEPQILSAIPEEAATIHRLLGARYNSPYFKHSAHKPLTADVVIVDEASMVDLPLMAKLLDALPDACRLMLVGDIDQLASVEPGRVYGDICQATECDGPLSGCLTRLEQSWRFPEDSVVGKISRLIKEGRGGDAWDALQKHSESEHLQMHNAEDLSDSNQEFAQLVEANMEAFMDAKKPEAALAAADRFRILCALRKGPCGVGRMNRRVETLLSKKGLKPGKEFYDHQLVMIRVNTPSLDLFNGDVGVVLEEKDAKANTRRLVAWFPNAEGQGPRPVPVSLLPEHETAFAMTIHKSQGSQFVNVAMVLPDTDESPVLTRELLYTGLTRVAIDHGKREGRLTIWCTEQSFKAAVSRKTIRKTGLFQQ